MMQKTDFLVIIMLLIIRLWSSSREMSHKYETVFLSLVSGPQKQATIL